MRRKKTNRPPRPRANLFLQSCTCPLTLAKYLTLRIEAPRPHHPLPLPPKAVCTLPCQPLSLASPALTTGLALALDRGHPQAGGSGIKKDQKVLRWGPDGDFSKVQTLGGHGAGC